MYPIHEYSYDFKLDKDDIDGIQVDIAPKWKFNRYKHDSIDRPSPLMIHLKRNLGNVREEPVQQKIGAWIKRYRYQ